MAESTIIPFGKYKDQPVELLVADDQYREWLVAQPWFRERYGNIYQTVINYGGQPQETPEHNAMQAAFLDDDLCVRLARFLCPDLETDQPGSHYSFQPAIFECGGWDVVFRYGGAQFQLELKPDLGDDFPTVLRQVKNHRDAFVSGFVSCVVVRRASFERVTLDQVQRMFASSRLRLVMESDL